MSLRPIRLLSCMVLFSVTCASAAPIPDRTDAVTTGCIDCINAYFTTLEQEIPSCVQKSLDHVPSGPVSFSFRSNLPLVLTFKRFSSIIHDLSSSVGFIPRSAIKQAMGSIQKEIETCTPRSLICAWCMSSMLIEALKQHIPESVETLLSSIEQAVRLIIPTVANVEATLSPIERIMGQTIRSNLKNNNDELANAITNITQNAYQYKKLLLENKNLTVAPHYLEALETLIALNTETVHDTAKLQAIQKAAGTLRHTFFTAITSRFDTKIQEQNLALPPAFVHALSTMRHARQNQMTCTLKHKLMTIFVHPLTRMLKKYSRRTWYAALGLYQLAQTNPAYAQIYRLRLNLVESDRGTAMDRLDHIVAWLYTNKIERSRTQALSDQVTELCTESTEMKNKKMADTRAELTAKLANLTDGSRASQKRSFATIVHMINPRIWIGQRYQRFMIRRKICDLNATSTHIRQEQDELNRWCSNLQKALN